MRPGESPQEVPLPDEPTSELDPSKSFRQQMGRVLVEQPVGNRLFVDAILEDLPAAPSFYDGWKAQQVIDAAIESHRSGTRVSVRYRQEVAAAGGYDAWLERRDADLNRWLHRLDFARTHLKAMLPFSPGGDE